MSSRQYVYIGIYFKVWMKSHKVESAVRVCLKCANFKELHTPYCPHCGSATVRTKELEEIDDPDELIKEWFGEYDHFSVLSIPHEPDGFYLLGNRQAQTGFLTISESADGNIEIPPQKDLTGDWVMLFGNLIKAKDQGLIQDYRKCYGIVVYHA